MVKMRKRDFAKPLPTATAGDIARLEQAIQKKEGPDIVRLERLVSKIPAPDLTPLEESLRNQRVEIKELREMVRDMKSAPVPVKSAPVAPAPMVDYHFDIKRDRYKLISSVEATAIPRQQKG